MNTSLPFAVSGTLKVLRYQPNPPGSAPPPNPAGFFSSNSPSMLQSCGKFSARHFVSSRSGDWPLVTSPKLNRQSLPKLIVFPGLAFANTCECHNTTSVTTRRQPAVSLFISLDSSSWYEFEIYPADRRVVLAVGKQIGDSHLKKICSLPFA